MFAVNLMLMCFSDKKPDVPVDEGNWAESGTLVWSPSSSTSTAGPSNPPPNPLPNPPPKRSSSLSRATSSAASKPTQEKSELTSAKRASSQPIPTKAPLPQPNHRKSKEDGIYLPENSSDTMKKNDYDGSKHKYIEPNDTPPNVQHDAPGPSTNNSEPKLTKTSDKSPSNRVPSVRQAQPARKKPPSPETIYPDQTVKVKEAANYTPQYMDFYKDEEPPLMVGEDQEESSQGSIVRRNSIDQRGIEKIKISDELQKSLDTVELEYCAELENVRLSCLNFHEALLDCIASHKSGMSTGVSSSKLSFYSKLDKLELSLMLKFVNVRHEEVLKTAKEHFDLEHRFLMNALRNTTDMDEEVRYNLSISENNELQAATLSKINRQFQSQSEEIMRALERIDYASAIAVDWNVWNTVM